MHCRERCACRSTGRCSRLRATASFTVTFTRSYRTADGEYRDTDGFSGSQLLRVARLVNRAYDRMRELSGAAQSEDSTEEEA